MPSASLTLDDLTIEGESRAGEQTWFRIHPPGLAFDVGRGERRLAGAADLFLTHGHLDHVLGLPFVLSQRRLHHLGPARVCCPAAVKDNLLRLIRAAESLEADRYEFELAAIQPGERRPVARGLSVEAFSTDHLIPSLGYHLLRTKRRLKAEFSDYSPAQLVLSKSRGIEVEEAETELWLSYCGDTGPNVFEIEPRLFDASILLLECTFIDPTPRSQGTRFKHIHLSDLVERAEEFRNRELVLHHLSRRYDRRYILDTITRQLSDIRPRLHLFGSS